MHRNHLFTRFWQTPYVRPMRQLVSPNLWFRRLTARRRCLPKFIIAGAQKAGTTSLFGYLADHPQCNVPLTKEVHYFDSHFARGVSWYRMHFPLSSAAAQPGERLGRSQSFEASPYYMFDPRVAARTQTTIPDAKVIFLLRNPVDRAFSHYQHVVRRGREPLPFEAAIDAEPGRLAGEQERMLADQQYQSDAHRYYSYLARGIYVDQLQRWQALFPREQLLVIEAEQLYRSPREAFGRVLDFLGLDRWMPKQFPTRNRGKYKSGMLDETRKRLSRYFAPHNERLFELLGTRYSWH